MKSRVIERAIYFTLAFALIALAVWPELRTGISDSVLFGVMSTILLVVGLRQLVITPRLADKVSEKMSHASMLRRLWLPARWYTRGVLLWQFRLASIVLITMAVLAGHAAFLAYRRGW